MQELDKYLVVNAGSSSLKFSLYEMPNQKELINGYIQKIGLEDSYCTLKIDGKKYEKRELVQDHVQSIKLMIKLLLENKIINSIDEIKGVGHRVLHGGEIYSKSTIIDDQVLKNIKELTKLGPLHHPGEIAGIEGTKKVLPSVPMVAVFDTAYHQTIPAENYVYPVPYEWYQKYGVRKYGFHGTSHNYITNTMKNILNNEKPNLIICHIGSGASITAVKDGKSFNTSMGLTPLDGLMMGTRCGVIDSSIINYMVKESNKSVQEITDELNNNSGLKGICGKSDLRDLEELANKNDKYALLALKLYVNSISNYIIQYCLQLEGNIDAIVFTAGGGENNFLIRELVVNKLSKLLNIKLDKEQNEKIASFKDIKEGIITTSDSKIPVYVIPTNEELMILNDTYNLINKMENKNILQKKLK